MPHSRPLSPHLQVYKPQMTSMLSILHRATGAALTPGLLAFAYWVGSLAMGQETFETAQNHFSSWYGLTALFGWSFCFFYHLANGIRHLFWDIGMGFELSDLHKSGWAVMISSLGLTLLFWGSICLVHGGIK